MKPETLKPATALDVAAYIRDRQPGLSTTKEQKLLYFSQAWSLAWYGVPLFSDPIEAWVGGPVVRRVWAESKFRPRTGNPATLTAEQRATVDAVIAFYGNYDGDTLSELTHRELPWVWARREVPSGAPSTHTLDVDVIKRAYAPLCAERGTIPDSYRDSIDAVLAADPDIIADVLLSAESPVASEQEMQAWLSAP